MKVYSHILAVACLGSTTAFTPQKLQLFTTSLRSSQSPESFPAPTLADTASPDKTLTKKPSPDVTVQGGSLRTWSFTTDRIDRVGVFLKTQGRPLNAEIDLWQGPDNCPQKISIYVEDGKLRPFSAVVETPGSQNAIAVRNTGKMEFPLVAGIEAEVAPKAGTSTTDRLDAVIEKLEDSCKPSTVQGGAIKTVPFPPQVKSVQILLTTDGRPLTAKIEFLQGPNNAKQIMEVYCEDGLLRPFFTVVETPGSGNVVRVLNTATMEYPILARVMPFELDEESDEGGSGGLFVVD